MPNKLQVLAAAALGAAYLEAKTFISEDASLIKRVVYNLIAFQKEVYTGQVNNFYMFERLAKSRPNDVALVFPRQIKPLPSKDVTSLTSEELDSCFQVDKYTFAQFYTNVLKYASVLHNHYGVNDKSVVALDCTNGPQFLFAWFALWSLGAAPAFINYNLANESLVHCVKTAESTLFLVENDPDILKCVDTVRNKLSGTPIVVMDSTFESLVSSAEPLRVPNSQRHPEHNHWDLAAYVYTSGTTGLPKAAIVPWTKFNVGARQFACAVQLGPSDRLYTAMPLYHGTASVLGVAAAFSAGASIAIGHKFSTSTFWTQAKLSDATVVQYVGETCRYLVNSPKSPDERKHHVRLATGNGMRPDIWRQFKERFNVPIVGEFFASTEGPFATTNYQSGEFGVGAVGKYGKFLNWLVLQQKHTLVKIDTDAISDDSTPIIWRDPKTGFCRKPKAGEPGEMISKLAGPTRVHESFRGYHGDNKSTSDKVIYNVFKKGDAYYRTGDLLKKNNEGFLYFVDRMGDTFRWKSENVATNEVEHVLTSFKKKENSDSEGPIHQAVVVGVSVPRHEGRAGFAVIQMSNGSTTPDENFIQELGPYMLSQLPRYAVPVFIKFVDKIESTGNNKVVKKQYRNQKFGKDNEAGNEETIYWLNGKTYVPLTDSDWDKVSTGKARL